TVADAFLIHAMNHVADTSVVQPVLITPATHGVAAALTDYQTLQQVARFLFRQAIALLVLAQLFLYGVEQRFLDGGRHRDAGPFLRRRAAITDGPAWLFIAIALRPLRQPWPDAPLAVAGASLVGGIAKHAPDRVAVPAGSTAR